MFYSLTGTIVMTDQSSVAISCGGVAFLCQTSANTLRKTGNPGDEVTLFTYLSVREDALELFGFLTQDELESFKLLISVNGVGPKMALAVLSEFTPEKLAFAVATGDSKAVTAAKGVGPKVALRIVNELKGKFNLDEEQLTEGGAQMFTSPPASSNTGEALSALEFLGYSKQEAQRALAGIDQTLSVEDMIKAALARML